jgi:SAM-dependent methyltransferase
MPDLLPCRLCGFLGLTVAVELTGMPRWNHRLLREHELASDRPVDLRVHRCPSCGFVSVAMQLADDYYDDYVNAPSLSPQAQQFQREQAVEFVERFGLKGSRVLEVGCGDGFFLHAVQQAGAAGFGVEPSVAQRALACARGLDVEPGILSGSRRMQAAPFDAFVTRQVFEHVEDIRDFLLTIRGNLRTGAVGLVEVPNLDKLVEERRFFDFIPEHINYFSPRSLALALQLAGFEVLDVAPVQEGESLRALVRWQPLPDCAPLAARVDTLRDDIARYLGECEAHGKKVALWGAGGKGLSMMAVADLKKVKLLVDSDPHKVGLFTPVSHLRVQPPQELAAQGIGAVIVMAPAYELEIARKLRSDWAFTGDIVLAGRGFERFDAIGDQA